MNTPDFGTSVTRRLVRRMIRLAVLAASAGFVLVVGYVAYAVSALPELQPWHTVRVDGEFSAARDSKLDFAGYLALEERLFAAASARATTWRGLGERYTYSRFNTQGRIQQLAAASPWNRSFRLSPEHPQGGALLVHGLTDSPYSMKALAESLYRRGFEVTVVRLPGHGTFPSMMLDMSYRDWRAAVRLAVRDVAARTRADQPFYVGGYSTGATLVLNYALDALDDSGLRKPDQVLLISPAIELAPVAGLASFIDAVSVVPVPVLEKVRWETIAAEYDPYKFNSFPFNALRQVNRATKDLQEALLAAEASGQLAQLPPTVTWQSAVDATVGAGGTVDLLYARLQGGRHRLVLFDVNRHEGLSSVQRPAAAEVIERAIAAHAGYMLEVVSSAAVGSASAALRRYAPASVAPELEALDLAWPGNVVSLGHVALPFPPDDPVYGFLPGSGRDGLPSLGSWLLRGEAGALTISLGSLTRLRSNPFWALVDRQVGELVAADLAAGLRAGPVAVNAEP
ncbi:MAG: alpha/beta hydrolase [Gammaproteobacteria bacterium]